MSKIVIRVKKTVLHDEYVLTNKHIVCKFKYLIVCYDHPENATNRQGFVSLNAEQFKELMNDQNIVCTSGSEGLFCETIQPLKEWHPAVTKLELDINNMYEVSDLSDYQLQWDHYHDYMTSSKYNYCIINKENFDTLTKQHTLVADLKVYFKLTKRINQISDYNVNFQYLHKLITDQLPAWNCEKAPFLDETSVNLTQIPLSTKTDEDGDESNSKFVYPYVNLVPLYWHK
jgi:hypothetical protein